MSSFPLFDSFSLTCQTLSHTCVTQLIISLIQSSFLSLSPLQLLNPIKHKRLMFHPSLFSHISFFNSLSHVSPLHLPIFFFLCSSVTLAFRFPVLTLKSFCTPSFHPLLRRFLFINFRNSPISSILYLSLSTSITIYHSKRFAAQEGEYLISGTPLPSLSPILLYYFGVDATTKFFLLIA
jgi:hypothetical protein